MKQKIKNEIIKILNDCEYWQPKMIIEEKEPFFWKINPDWLEDKSNRLSELFEKQKQEIVEEIEGAFMEIAETYCLSPSKFGNMLVINRQQFWKFILNQLDQTLTN